MGSSEEALRWIDENGAPNVISTDLGLPVLSGFRLCEKLRARADMNDVPIAVVSARIDVKDQARAMEISADAFIEKPLGLRRYAETVSALLTPDATRTMLFVP